MKKIFTFCFILLAVSSFAQDTVTVMTYNLMNFGNNTSYCTTDNNNLSLKRDYLKTISHYVMPDLLGVNEVAGHDTGMIRFIVDSILNTDGVTCYKHILRYNSSGSDIISSFYYNSNKFKFYNSNFLQTDLRDIIMLTLYYNSPDVANHDTAFIRFIDAHLKAGSTGSDEDSRASETTVLMNYLNSLGTLNNSLVMGDFNVQSSSEQCFQNLINYTNQNIRFYDPVNQLGTWHDNPAMTKYQTQAAQVISNNCTAGGGLDDRFDFILASFSVMNNLQKVNYVTNSYKVIGQDGNHLNKSVDNPANYSVPANVLTALANMSDHLPVTLKLAINQTHAIGFQEANWDNYRLYPVSWLNNTLVFNVSNEIHGNVVVELYDILGKKVLSKHIYLSSSLQNVPVTTPNVPKGLYILKLQDKDIILSAKVLKME
jgi:hypothetical protein